MNYNYDTYQNRTTTRENYRNNLDYASDDARSDRLNRSMRVEFDNGNKMLELEKSIRDIEYKTNNIASVMREHSVRNDHQSEDRKLRDENQTLRSDNIIFKEDISRLFEENQQIYAELEMQRKKKFVHKKRRVIGRKRISESNSKSDEKRECSADWLGRSLTRLRGGSKQLPLNRKQVYYWDKTERLWAGLKEHKRGLPQNGNRV